MGSQTYHIASDKVTEICVTAALKQIEGLIINIRYTRINVSTFFITSLLQQYSM